MAFFNMQKIKKNLSQNQFMEIAKNGISQYTKSQ